MEVVAIMNQKGGVGKTTTTLNLGHALALAGRRVLLLDMDPQAHLTAALGVSPATPGCDRALLDGADPQTLRHPVRDRLDLVPAGPRLAEVEHVRGGGARRGMRLREALAASGDSHDLVLVDCPPSAGLLAMNALFAAGELLVPVSGDFLALQSLSRFMAIVRQVEEAVKRPFRKRLVLTRFQARRRLAREVRDKLLEYFPGQLLATPIREAVALAESPGFGTSIFEYRARSSGAADYLGLARDWLEGRTC